jgi:molybdenum cofactor cytidylyltransferase
MLTAVILAAGESKRMGSPKALLLHHHRTFLQHLLDVTVHPQISKRRIVLGAGAEDIIERAGIDRAATVVNPDWENGQLSSIQAALRSLSAEPTDGVLLCLVDQPLITSTLVNSLVGAFYRSGKAIVLPSYHGRRGHPVIFASKLFDELLAASAETGARAVVWNHPAEVEEVSTEEEGAVLNLNDPATFRRATGST